MWQSPGLFHLNSIALHGSTMQNLSFFTRLAHREAEAGGRQRNKCDSVVGPMDAGRHWPSRSATPEPMEYPNVTCRH